MTRLLLFCVLTLGALSTQGQTTKFSIDIGAGYTDAEGFPGFNVDGQFTYIYKRLHIGPVIHVMSTYEQVNSPSDVLMHIFEAVPAEQNAFGYSYTRTWQRSQAHLGLQIGFDAIQATRLRLNLSVGYGYSRYRELKFVENYLDPRWPHLTLFTRKRDNFDFNYGLSLSYDVYKTLFIGTRVRYVAGITDDVSYIFFVGFRM